MIGDSLWGLQTALVAPMTVLAILMVKYGASETMIGSISAVESGLIVLPQILGNYVVVSTRSRKRRLIVWHFLTLIPFLFVMGLVAYLAETVSPALVRWALLLAFAGHYFSMGAIVAVWMDWSAHLFSKEIRGRVLGITWGLYSGMGTFGALLSGWLIELQPASKIYALLYLSSGLLALMSMVVFALIRDPASEVPDRMLRLRISELMVRFRESMRHANFRSYLLGRMLAAAGFSILPFLTVYFRSDSGGSLSEGFIVSSGAAMTLGWAVASVILGRVGDRKGHRVGLLAAIGFQVISLLLVLFGGGPISCVLSYAAAGVSRGGMLISGMNLMFETCPHESRMAHIMVGNLTLSIVTISVPLLAGKAAGLWGVGTVFLISLLLSVCALLWTSVRMKEPRFLSAHKA